MQIIPEIRGRSSQKLVPGEFLFIYVEDRRKSVYKNDFECIVKVGKVENKVGWEGTEKECGCGIVYTLYAVRRLCIKVSRSTNVY